MSSELSSEFYDLELDDAPKLVLYFTDLRSGEIFRNDDESADLTEEEIHRYSALVELSLLHI